MTPASVDAGSSLVIGSVGYGGLVIDRDDFRFIVPAGFRFTFILDDGHTAPQGQFSWLANTGRSADDPHADGGGVGNLLAGNLYSSSQIGTDILPAVAIGSRALCPAALFPSGYRDTAGRHPTTSTS